MCGKFTQMASWKDVHAFSQPLTVEADEIVISTPMRMAQIMRLNWRGEREVVAMRWGFSDRHAATPVIPKHMHARGETVDTKPTFADAFTNCRGILLVHTFNEGEELATGRTKQWTVIPRDRKPIAIGVIWEEWHSPAQTLLTFVQITVAANTLISQITDRMPAIIQEKDWPMWIGETNATLAEVKALLDPYEGDWYMDAERKAKSRTTEPPGLF